MMNKEVAPQQQVFEPTEEFRQQAYLQSREEYAAMYDRSIKDPEGFWSEMAEQLHWFKKWEQVKESDFVRPHINWFRGGKLNVSYNCLDRHLTTARKNKAAIIWEGDQPGESKTYTYQQLHREVNRFANVLRKKGVRKGDRVAIYMQMIPQLVIAMLACTRIGAVHTIVFGGFSAEVRVTD